MPAYLVPCDELGRLVPLEKAILLVGRQADCDIVLDKSRKVSRKHCAIAQVNAYFVVRDLGSTNGLTVNGKKVQRESKLNVGDVLAIGDVKFRLQTEPQSRAVLPTSARSNAAAMVSSEIPVVIDDLSDDLDAIPVDD